MACLLAACQTDDWREARGGIRVSLGEASVGVETKSTPEELGKPLTTEFNVRVVKEGGSEIYNGKFPDETIPASAGTYTVTASYGENAGIAWDAPYYEGTTEEPVVVKDGETATATVTCKVANALFSATFPPAEEMEKAYEAYGLKVTVGSTSMTFKPGETRHIYVKAGSAVKYAFAYTRLSGEEGEAPLTSDKLPTAPEAGTHYTINLTMDDKLGLDISKVEAEEVSISETIPLEWLPAPKVNGFDGRNSVVYTETAAPISAVLAFSGSHTIQDVEFSFEFADAQNQFQALNEKIFKLSELSEEDRTLLNAASIILPTLDGTNKGQFDFTAMTGNLQTNAGAETVNKIKLRVQANNRWSSEAPESYEIKTVAPKFKVDAYPGNIWTKEFTMNALREEQVESGDFNKLSSDMTYQFSANGSSNWENLGDDLKKGGLTPGSTYYIRGLYRGEVPGEAVEVMTYPIIKLENGGLEGAEIVRGSDDAGFWKPKDYGAQYEWPNWATLNALSAGYSWKTAYSFNSRSGTRPTSDKPEEAEGNTAVRIITLAYGSGGTDSDPKSFMHSELFLGEFIEEGSIKNYGISFTSKPTGVRFFYKCISNMNNDMSEVKIQIYNDQILLGESVFQTGAKDLYEDKTLYIDYKNDQNSLLLEPNRLSIVFKSGVKESLSKSDLKQFGSGVTNSQEDPMWRGNELFIDDVELVYDK